MWQCGHCKHMNGVNSTLQCRKCFATRKQGSNPIKAVKSDSMDSYVSLWSCIAIVAVVVMIYNHALKASAAAAYFVFDSGRILNLPTFASQSNYFWIDFHSSTNLSEDVLDALNHARDKWGEIIDGANGAVFIDIETGLKLKHLNFTRREIRNMQIQVEIKPLEDKVLGTGGTYLYHDSTQLPIFGIITLDVNKIKKDLLRQVVLHEVGHALGFSKDNPQFKKYVDESTACVVGPAVSAVVSIMSSGSCAQLASKNDLSHWNNTIKEESILDVMVPHSGTNHVITKITKALFQDIGYKLK